MKSVVDPSRITEYHAHVYYDAATREAAAQVRAAIEARFPVRMGRWRDEPVGPHPQAMYQVAFDVAVFPALVPWLMLNRGHLVVLVHPETGDDLADHSRHAMWLGAVLPLRLDVFRPRAAAG